MTDKNHSQTLVGSRHAIHNLTYPDAANRIAGTNEGKGIVPLTINNLWQIAKQDDDDSLWMCVDTAPLTWDQIMTGTSGNLDVGYDAFGGAGTVNIDAGTLTWDIIGAYDFNIELENTSTAQGFKVEISDVSHYFLLRNVISGGNRLWLDFNGSKFDVTTSGASAFHCTDSFLAESDAGLFLWGEANSEIILTGAASNLTLGARDDTVLLNESGATGLSGAFTAVSLVGGLNELMGGGLGVFTDAVSITKAGTVKTNVDFLSLTNMANAVDMDGTSTGVLWNQWYYDGVTPAIADAGRIAVGTEQDWTSTVGTQDSYMAFETALDGTVSEKVRITSAGVLKVGGGTPGIATGLGDLYVTNKIELADQFYIKNDKSIVFGNSGLVHLKYNTAQTPDTLTMGLGSASNSMIFGQLADLAYDFAHGLQSTPTLFFQSDAQSATEWGSLTHDGDYFRFNTGAGSVCIGTGTPAYAVGVGDLFTTDAMEIGGSQYCLNSTFYLGSGSTGFSFGTGSNPTRFFMNETFDQLLLACGSDIGRQFIIGDFDYAGTDHGHATPTNPTLFGHAATDPAGAGATHWWSHTHDQTNAVWASGAGGLALAPASGEIILPDAGKIVYDIAPASDTTATGDITSSTVDSNATGIGAALYQAADGNWDEADASALVTMPCRALAIEAGTGTKKILRRGWIRDDSWSWTPGGPVYVSTTTGALTQTKPSATGNQVQIVGYAETADVLDFNPASFILEVA